MKTSLNNQTLTIYAEGHIDSSNSPAFEKDIFDSISNCSPESVVIDAKNLDYISSAGLRVVLKLRKTFSDLKIINVSSDVYEIFDVTGFTEIVDVEKAYREYDVSGCELIGEGANGKVYRVARDTIVKVYKDAESLDDIKRERELSRTAFIMGIPTAIPYDVVKVGNTYGSVFELLNAKSFCELMVEDPEGNLEFVASESVRIAKIMHSTDAPSELPKQKDQAVQWIKEVDGRFSEERMAKLKKLIDELPETGKMIHGDLHIKNIMLQNNETLLIDMDTLCSGNPIYELAFMFNAYIGFGIADKSGIENFFKISVETTHKLWDRILRLYCETDDPARLEDVERKASLIGYLRVMRRAITKNIDDDVISMCHDKLCELIDSVDSLDI